MCLETGEIPLVLLAPAWRWFDVPCRVKLQTTILHSREDTVISPDDSQQLAADSNLPAESLIWIGENHSLNDPEAQAALLAAITN